MCKGQIILLAIAVVLYILWTRAAYLDYVSYELEYWEEQNSWLYKRFLAPVGLSHISWVIVHFFILILFPIVSGIMLLIKFLWTWC